MVIAFFFQATDELNYKCHIRSCISDLNFHTHSSSSRYLPHYRELSVNLNNRDCALTL